MTDAATPALEPLSALIGDWTIEMTHPALPDTVARGRVTFEWLDGGHFVIQRAVNDHPDFPNSISIIGAEDAPAHPDAVGGEADEDLRGRYFDSRGVYREYAMSLRDRVWRIWRDEPGFSQRFAGSLSDDGRTIEGRFELAREQGAWADDVAITYRRAGDAPGG